MDAFIYINGRLPCGLDEIEDALDDALGDHGEVSGTGTGEVGSNIDVTIEDDEMEPAAALAILRSALSRFSLPQSTTIVIGEDRFGLS